MGWPYDERLWAAMRRMRQYRAQPYFSSLTQRTAALSRQPFVLLSGGQCFEYTRHRQTNEGGNCLYEGKSRA